MKKSPLLNRSGSPPQISLVSLKNFSGLENVRPLPNQDSLRSTQQPSTDSVRSSSSSHHHHHHQHHLQMQESVRSTSGSHHHHHHHMQSQDSLRGSTASGLSHMVSQDSIRSGASHSSGGSGTSYHHHHIAGQDSVDSVNHMLRAIQIPSTDRQQEGSGGGGGHERQNIAIIEENRVKIQVPGLPAAKSTANTTTASIQSAAGSASSRTQISTSGYKSEEH